MITARFAPSVLAAVVLLTGFVSTHATARPEMPAPVADAPKVLAAPTTLAPSKPTFEPAQAFNELGCVGCHGDDGVYRDEIKGAIGKPVDQVARWIRDAPSIKPGTDMPSFHEAIDVPDSVVLAAWMQNRAAHLDGPPSGN